MKSTCKYFSVRDFQLLNKSRNNLNILHSNINGLESKLENLHVFLSSTTNRNKMDVIALTETSEKEDVGFFSNIEIDEYMNYHSHSKLSKGGNNYLCK